MSDDKATILITPTARMFFPTVINPRPYEENGVPKGDPRYSLSLILEPGDLKSFKQYDDTTKDFEAVNFSDVLFKVAAAKWPEIDDVKAAVKHGGIGWPIKKGDAIVKKKKGKHAEHLAGKFLVSAGSIEKYAPVLKAIIDGKVTDLNPALTEDVANIKALFTGGNYALAEINVKGTEAADKKYLTLYLNGVTFVKPGERIGGSGGEAMDKYAGTLGGEAAVDPTGGDGDIDDEIPC